MKLIAVLALLFSILHLTHGGMSLTGTIPVSNSWGADYIAPINDSTILLAYEDTGHTVHVTFLDVESGDFSNDVALDFSDYCNVDGANSFFLLYSHFLYISCSSAWNDIYLIEYDIDVFNISRTMKNSSAVYQDIGCFVISPDAKYLYASQNTVTYIIQIELETFSVVNNIPFKQYGQFAYVQGMHITSKYLYTSLYTGQLLSIDLNKFVIHATINNLKGDDSAFIANENNLYNLYDDQITIYDNNFNVVKVLDAKFPNPGLFPLAALINDQYVYWLQANGIINLQLSTNQVSYLPLTSKHSVGPTALVNLQNDNTLAMSVCLSDNDFGAGVIYTLQQS